MSDSMRSAVLAASKARKGPTRATLRVRAAATYAVCAAVMLGIFELAGGLAHCERPVAITVGVATGAVALAIAATVVGARRGGSMLGRPRWVLLALLAVAPPLVLGWMRAWYPAYVEPFERVGVRCLGLALVMAAVLASGLFWLRRSTDAAQPATTGAALGLVAAAWSGALVDLWCPLTNVPHVLVGHVLPLLVCAGAGALVGRVVLRVRRRAALSS